MIHIRIDGMQIPGNQALLVIIEPYTTDLYTSPRTVGVTGGAGTHIVIPDATLEENDYVEIRNVSTGGQIIYIDSVVTVSDTQFVAILYPGETWEVANTDIDLYAVASAAGNSIALRVFQRGP